DFLSHPTTPTPPMQPGGIASMVSGPSTLRMVRRDSSTLHPTQADIPGDTSSSLDASLSITFIRIPPYTSLLSHSVAGEHVPNAAASYILSIANRKCSMVRSSPPRPPMKGTEGMTVSF